MKLRAIISFGDKDEVIHLILVKINGRKVTRCINSRDNSSMVLSQLIGVELSDGNGNMGLLESMTNFVNEVGKLPSHPSRGALYLLYDKGIRALVIRMVDSQSVSICFVSLPDCSWVSTQTYSTMLEELFALGHSVYCGTFRIADGNTTSYQIAQYIASLCMH